MTEGTELKAVVGGLADERAAVEKIKRKVEFLREAIYDAAELGISVELHYGGKTLSMHKDVPMRVEASVNLT